jgi:hypothetical protein
MTTEIATAGKVAFVVRCQRERRPGTHPGRPWPLAGREMTGVTRANWNERTPGGLRAGQEGELPGARPSLALTVSAPEGAPPALEWAGPSPRTADGLLAAAARARPADRPRERARHFLTALLKDGPRTTRQLWEAVRPERLTRRTLLRAKGELDIRSVRVWAGGPAAQLLAAPGPTAPPRRRAGRRPARPRRMAGAPPGAVPPFDPAGRPVSPEGAAYESPGGCPGAPSTPLDDL